MAAAAAVCTTCQAQGHVHTGEVCTTCGHQTRTFAAVQHRGPTPASLHFEAFDRSTCEDKAFDTLFAYAKIMRERVFVTQEKVVTREEEFDPQAERVSRHIYGLIGDAPVAYMRWRVLGEPTGKCVVMERILVLNSHRRRSIGRQLVAFALQDIVQKVQMLGITITAIAVPVPDKPPYVLRLFQSFGFKPAGTPFMARGRKRVRMIITPQDVVKSAQAFAAMTHKASKLGCGTGVTDPIALAEAQERERLAAAEDARLAAASAEVGYYPPGGSGGV